MNLTKEEATRVVQENLPEHKIEKGPVQYQDKFLFQLFEDCWGGDLDPFYSVNIKTGDFPGFSILQDPGKFIDLFEKDDYLAHYGVLGMKWGVRKDGLPQGTKGSKGPSNASVAAQAILDTPPVSLLARYLIPNTTAMSYGLAVTVDYITNHGTKTLSEVALDHAKNKKTLIGIGVNIADSGKYRTPLVLGNWKKNETLSKPNMSLSEITEKVVKPVNPQFPGLGTTNNCMRATYTYEMRRRGYDVTSTKTIFATGQTKTAQKMSTLSRAKNTKIKRERVDKPFSWMYLKVPKSSTTMKTLGKEPNGSRGELQMRWKGGGGHSVAYEIIKGKPVVIDAQSGKTYTTSSQLDTLLSSAFSASYLRLDDKNLNDMSIAAWVKNTK